MEYNVERIHKPFMVTDFDDQGIESTNDKELSEDASVVGNIEYRDEHMDSHSGQHDYELGLYIDDEIIGMVQYTLYDGELTVKDIIVRPEFRRKGYGSKMMKYIKQKHPDYEYQPSMQTDLGSKFKHKDVDLQEVKNMVRQILRENLGERYLLVPFYEDTDLSEFGMDEYEAADKAEEIAKDGGVTILRGQELSGILIDSEASKVIGGLWVSNNPDKFSFDIAIDSGYQNMGLSSELIEAAISEYEDQKDVYGDDFKMEVDVINPKLANILDKKYGFNVVGNISQDRVLMTIDEVKTIVREVLKESVISEIIEDSFEAFHGSNSKITKFTDSFVGGEKANDAQGAGIYFATNPEDAGYYGDHIYKARIKGRFLDRNTPIENVDPEELVKLIKMKDEWEMNAQDYSEDPEVGAYEAANMAIRYNQDEAEAFQQIEADFYRYDSAEYVRNMVKLGYDGIIVDAPSDVPGDKHIIVFNPNAITLIDKIR